MMSRQSPLMHRHDGTSPLPLGMDWCPPRKLNGRDTPLTYDRAGWSYHVAIPSWVFLPKSRDSDPVVFYKVQAGIQSPEGSTTSRGILKRFSDFTRLFADLKKAYPKRILPTPPPKGILRKKSRALIEERRVLLEQWMGKLLSDIDISRCIIIAAFLELEAAVRHYFQDLDSRTSGDHHSSNDMNGSIPLYQGSGLSLAGASSSAASDYGSETAYEISERETPSVGRDTSSEVGTEDLTLDGFATSIQNFVKYGISNIDEGLLMGETLMEQLGRIPRAEVHNRNAKFYTVKDSDNKRVAGDALGSSSGALKIFPDHMHSDGIVKSSTLESESVVSSVKSGEVSHSKNLLPSSVVSCGTFDGADVLSAKEVLGSTGLQCRDDVEADLSLEQEQKVNKVLTSMQQRLITAKADMEDMVARLNQEVAVKDYLMTKVKDLEVELETTKEKSKENLRQAILLERERVTQMQWDMEDLRRRSLELEFRLKSEKDGEKPMDGKEAFLANEKDEMQHQLEEAKEHLNDVQKKYVELEVKSKSDIKVLVKEVKSLRSLQTDLKQDLNKLLEAKSEAENRLSEEKQRNEHATRARQNMLEKWRFLWQSLQQCNAGLPSEGGNQLSDYSNRSESPDVLSATENKLVLILTEADDIGRLLCDKMEESNSSQAASQSNEDMELIRMLKDMFSDHVRLRGENIRISLHLQAQNYG